MPEIKMDLKLAESVREQMRALADELAMGLYGLDSETNASLADWLEDARDGFVDAKTQWLQAAEVMYKDLQAAQTILAAAMNAYKGTTHATTKMWAGS